MGSSRMPGLRHVAILLFGLLLLLGSRATAHFLVLLPSTDIVEDQDSRTVDLDLRFTHPMEQCADDEPRAPRQIAALVRGKRIDLPTN